MTNGINYELAKNSNEFELAKVKKKTKTIQAKKLLI